MVLEYYYSLRSVLRANPHLRRCRTRCRHCGIYFLTDPRNRKRRDLGCPFGCRAAHRKRRSTERSVEYYRTAEGKFKKRRQNGKRGKAKEEEPLPVEEEAPLPAEEGEPSEKEMPGATVDVVGFDADMVSYLQMVTSLIEGRRVGREEILEMLARNMRQHSIARRKRTDYVVWYLNKNPP